MFRVTEPLVGILPQQFKFVVKCKHIYADFNDEVLRLRVSGKVCNHQPLMHVIGNVQFAFGVSVALPEFIGRGGAFHLASRAI